MEIESHSIDLKNRDKIFFPEDGITKGDLIDYYEKISGYLLPYLKNRPLTLKRFPNGIKEQGFFQKEIPDYFPGWMDTIEVEKKTGGTNKQVICNNKAALLYLVNQGTLSFHIWLSTATNINKPDRLIFDLDPPKGKFDMVVEGVLALHSLLHEELGLPVFVMTTGSKGLHVVSPLEPEKDFDEVRSFAKNAADYLAGNHPDKFTVETRKDQRKGRLFIDYLRNAYAQTAIPPFSVRSREGAPVAAPLGWDELSKSGLSSQSYHIKNIFKRLSQKKDPWSQFQHASAKLDESIKKLNNLMNE